MPLATPAPKAPPRLVQLSSDFIRVKEYLEAIVASTSDAICTTDTRGRILYFSPGAESLLGVAGAATVGRPAHRFYQGGKAEGEKIMRLLRRQGSLKNHEMILKSSDGRLIHVSMSAALLKDKAGQVIGTIGISKDITSRVELETRLRELSITDSLTGLYNQRHFRDRLEQEASRARRQGYPLSLILMDLDGFKEVNDSRGHLEGDRVLKSFSEVLLASIRKETDSAFRYGGDEFTVLLPGSEQGRAEKVARRIVSAADAELGPRGLRFSYGVSSLARGMSPERLVRDADALMFRMKAARKPSRRAR